MEYIHPYHFFTCAFTPSSAFIALYLIVFFLFAYEGCPFQFLTRSAHRYLLVKFYFPCEILYFSKGLYVFIYVCYVEMPVLPA